jgi:hypothetical protein
MYLRYALYAPVSLLTNLFVILTSPFWAAIAAVLKLHVLPGKLSWLHTDDDDIYGSNKTGEPIPSSVWGRWVRAMWWLCRNPGFGVARQLLGRQPEETPTSQFRIKVIQWPVGNKWDSGEPAIMHYVLLGHDGRQWFNYRRDIPWSKKRFIKLWLGWNDEGRLKVMLNPFRTAGGGG